MPPTKRTCWKCGHVLTGLPDDTDCPECGADVPIHDVFIDEHTFDTPFQRVDLHPMHAAGEIARVGKQTRPSAWDTARPATKDEVRRAQETAERLYPWFLRTVLLIIAGAFTTFAVSIHRANQTGTPAWLPHVIAIVAAVLWLTLFATFLPKRRTQRS